MTLRDLTPWRSSRFPVRSGFGSPFSMFHHEMDRLLSDFSRGFGAPSRWSDIEETVRLMPRLDVDETDTAYEISVELPGIDEKNVEMTLVDGVLTIKGERSARHGEEDREYRRRERIHGAFMRQFTLPDTVDAQHISATVADGVLEIVIAKAEKPQPKKISVN